MLLDKILANKVTCYATSFNSWQEAIAGAAAPMIREGFITSEYVDQLIECVNKYGPYIVIAPNIAMPHSTEGAVGVNKTCIGLMVVENPVSFDENDPEKDARLFFTLASNNHEEHLNNMVELSEMLMDDALVEALLEVRSDEDLRVLSEKVKNT